MSSNPLIGFDEPMSKLPLSVTHLHFGPEYNQEIKELPLTIVSLDIGPAFKSPIQLPPRLTHLTSRSSIVGNWKLPPHLTHLTLHGAEELPDLSHLSKLKTLHANTSRFDPKVNNLPASLENLHYSHANVHNWITSLPPDMKKLSTHNICMTSLYPHAPP